MKKKSLLYRFVYGNKIVTTCVVFTIVTLFDMIVCVSFYGRHDISYWNIGFRFAFCILFIMSLSAFSLKFLEKLPLCIVLLIHFLISIGIILVLAWFTGFFAELHPDAYRDSVRSVVMIYALIVGGGVAYDCIRTAIANRILRNL